MYTSRPDGPPLSSIRTHPESSPSGVLTFASIAVTRAVIPEAEAYGYYNWRVTEMWAREVEPYGSRGKGSVISKRFPNQIERQGCPGAEFGQVEWWGGPDFRQNVHLTVPARPTEDFHGPFYAEYERSILRWFIVMKYPEGVPVDEGEDWYLNVHAKEAAQQPGLDRYFSHRAVDTPGNQQNPIRKLKRE